MCSQPSRVTRRSRPSPYPWRVLIPYRMLCLPSGMPWRPCKPLASSPPHGLRRSQPWPPALDEGDTALDFTRSRQRHASRAVDDLCHRRVASAYWWGCSTPSNCLAKVRATTQRRRSPTTNPREPADGLRTATNRPQAREGSDGQRHFGTGRECGDIDEEQRSVPIV